MKELTIQSGGRRLFNEDLVSLQNHLISIQNIFASEEPFVLSGLSYTLVSGTSYDVSEGYVWLGNKIRYVAPQNGLDVSTPKYINVSDSTSSRLYEDNVTRVAEADYSVVIENTSAGGNDTLRIDQISNIRRYYENVLGDKYLQLDSSQTEYITSNISTTGTISSTANITTSAQLNATNIQGDFGNITTFTSNTIESDSIKSDIYLAGDGSGAVINNDGSISDNRVITNSITDSAITSSKIQDLAITTSKLDNLSVTEGKLASDSVSTIKVQDLAITTPKIADSAINADKLDYNAVTTVKILNDAVTEEKLDNNSVGSDQIQDDSVGYSELAIPVPEVLFEGSSSSMTVPPTGSSTTWTFSHNLDLDGFGNYNVICEAFGSSSTIATSVKNWSSDSFTVVLTNVGSSGNATGVTLRVFVVDRVAG